MRELLSKLVAGGLSAAVILLWWPNFVHDEGAVSWLARGVAWTLSFELLLQALLPLERALWESAAARRVRDRATRLSPPRRTGSRAALACGALAVPAALLATAPAPPPEESPAPVRHVTQIKRVIRVDRAPAAPVSARPPAPGIEQAPGAAAAPAPVVTRPAAPRRRTAPPAPRTTQPRRGADTPEGTRTAPDAPSADESPAPQPRSSSAERAGRAA